MLFACILILAASSLAENVEDDTIKQDSSEEDFFEGDLKLTKEQIQEALNGASRGLLGGKQWPGGIVYYTINTRRPLRKILIHSAIREWEEFTCLRFRERTHQKDYIEFLVETGGCWSSSVGRRGGKQTVSLGFGCITHGIVVHEIGHAVGFWHEQSRWDRDEYVEILWDNISKGQKHNFAKRWSSIDSLDSPYDYGSIMHYGKRDFAKWPWQVTIKTKNGAKIGQRRHLSKLDREKMNKYYKCNKK